MVPHVGFFLSLQNAMNLPPDKARLLRQYDNEKKWELICDQVRAATRACSRHPVESMHWCLGSALPGLKTGGRRGFEWFQALVCLASRSIVGNSPRKPCAVNVA